MDNKDFSAPPSIELNLKEDDTAVESPPPPEIGLEEKNKAKDEMNEVAINNTNNGEKKDEEKKEEEEEEEQQQLPRPLLRDFVYEIGTCRKVFQSIAISIVYGLVIWGLILQINDGISYGLIDIIILFAFGTFMLIFTIIKRTTGGLKYGIITVVIFFGGAVPIVINSIISRKGTMKYVILLIVRQILLMPICTLNCNQ